MDIEVWVFCKSAILVAHPPAPTHPNRSRTSFRSLWRCWALVKPLKTSQTTFHDFPGFPMGRPGLHDLRMQVERRCPFVLTITGRRNRSGQHRYRSMAWWFGRGETQKLLCFYFTKHFKTSTFMISGTTGIFYLHFWPPESSFQALPRTLWLDFFDTTTPAFQGNNDGEIGEHSLGDFCVFS